MMKNKATIEQGFMKLVTEISLRSFKCLLRIDTTELKIGNKNAKIMLIIY